ncbi:MAG: hypothetical protein WKF77_12355 [Planctomycetaceae bacterium]
MHFCPLPGFTAMYRPPFTCVVSITLILTLVPCIALAQNNGGGGGGGGNGTAASAEFELMPAD